MNSHKKINKTLEIILILLMSVLVIDVLWQVFSRYILSSPSSFTDELAGFLLIWVGLLGAAYVAGRSEHLAIDILLQKLEPKNKRRLQIMIHIIILIFGFFVMPVGGGWLVYSRFLLDVRSAALEIPLGDVYTVIPISGILISYYSILFIIEIKKSK